MQSHVLELLIIVVAIADALILSNGVIIGALWLHVAYVKNVGGWAA